MKHEIKDAIIGKPFLGSCAIILICLLGISVPEWISSIGWGAEYRQSALQQSIGGIFFGGIMLLLPCCSCLPYATSQIDEVNSSVMRLKLLRSSFAEYAIKKIIAVAISGGAAVTVPFILHSLVWNIIALPCDPTIYPYHTIAFYEQSLYCEWYSYLYGLPMYISIALGLFVSGACWASVSLAVAIWIPDKLMAIAIPTCICYLLSADIFNVFLGISLPHPSTLYNDALTADAALKSLIEYGTIFATAVFLYLVGLKRRVFSCNVS